MQINNNTQYIYRFLLDSPVATPDLDSRADKVEKFTDQCRMYTFDLPAVVGGSVIESDIQYIVINCKPFKLIVVGDMEGHTEVYQSEDYEGGLGISATIPGIMEKCLWGRDV